MYFAFQLERVCLSPTVHTLSSLRSHTRSAARERVRARMHAFKWARDVELMVILARFAISDTEIDPY